MAKDGFFKDISAQRAELLRRIKGIDPNALGTQNEAGDSEADSDHIRTLFNNWDAFDKLWSKWSLDENETDEVNETDAVNEPSSFRP